MNELNYMEMVIEYAKKAYLVNEVPIAALLVDNNSQKILSIKHNETIKQKNPLKHAEILVIEESCKLLNNACFENTSMFVTLEPCAMCASAISKTRIKKIYFGAYDEKNGAIENNLRIYTNKNFFRPDVYGGIREKECSNLIKNFFSSKR